MLTVPMTVTLNNPHPPLPNHYNTDISLMYVSHNHIYTFKTLRPKKYVVLALFPHFKLSIPVIAAQDQYPPLFPWL